MLQKTRQARKRDYNGEQSGEKRFILFVDSAVLHTADVVSVATARNGVTDKFDQKFELVVACGFFKLQCERSVFQYLFSAGLS